jgi:DnaJ family protein A protein 5
MGQESSSLGNGRQEQESYYTILGVEQTASDEEVKRAYRRKALELHPDRNFGREVEATQQFAVVQGAYEVLSDSQERAWYDSHRGGHNEAEVASSETVSHDISGVTTADLLRFFDPSFTRRMDDSEKGFFTVYEKVFRRLAEDEREACARQDLDLEERSMPSFGYSKLTHDDGVKQFYSAWNSFHTQKSFLWAEVYKLSEAPDRRIRRAMEKENKRLRDAAIREFNDTVRSLVAFVRKRDPRYQLPTESERHATTAEESRKQAHRARAAFEASLHSYVEPEWIKEQTERMNEILAEFEESEEEEVVVYECQVCNKKFKNVNQFAAHEKSKKHVKAVEALRRQMRRENKDLDLEDRTEEDEDYVGLHEPEVEDDTSLHEADDEPIQVDTGQSSQAASMVDSVNEGLENTKIENGKESSDDEYGTMEDLQKRFIPESDEEETATPKLGKAKQKKLKNEAKNAARGQKAKLVCSHCQEPFPSKNQLFQHLSENPDHASLKASASRKKR